MKPKPSLKGRALQWLAQREHSRAELRAKLLRRARTDLAAAQATVLVSATEPAASPCPEEAVDAILDWLEAHQYLDDGRFIESRVNARAARHGNLRIRQELALHGLSLSVEEAQALKESEFARAGDVWRRKFGVPPADAADRARQMRFLGGRGFSAEVIRRVVQGGACDDD